MNPEHSPNETRNAICPSRLNVHDWNLPEFNYYYDLHSSQKPHSLCDCASGKIHALLMEAPADVHEVERISRGVRLRGRGTFTF